MFIDLFSSARKRVWGHCSKETFSAANGHCAKGSDFDQNLQIPNLACPKCFGLVLKLVLHEPKVIFGATRAMKTNVPSFATTVWQHFVFPLGLL